MSSAGAAVRTCEATSTVQKDAPLSDVQRTVQLHHGQRDSNDGLSLAGENVQVIRDYLSQETLRNSNFHHEWSVNLASQWTVQTYNLF